MSYNIHHGRGTDDKVNLGRIAKLINDWSPDLVALQEVDNATSRSNFTNQTDTLALKTKMFSNGLTLKDGYFQSSAKNKIPGFKVLNMEEPGTFDEKKDISLIAIGLHLKGQKDVAKTFDQMIDLGKNLERSFDMKLLDESFNKITDQTIGNYKENANAIDLKLGSYAN